MLTVLIEQFLAAFHLLLGSLIGDHLGWFTTRDRDAVREKQEERFDGSQGRVTSRSYKVLLPRGALEKRPDGWYTVDWCRCG